MWYKNVGSSFSFCHNSHVRQTNIHFAHGYTMCCITCSCTVKITEIEQIGCVRIPRTNFISSGYSGITYAVLICLHLYFCRANFHEMCIVHFETVSVLMGGFYGENYSLPTSRDEIALPYRSPFMSSILAYLVM